MMPLPFFLPLMGAAFAGQAAFDKYKDARRSGSEAKAAELLGMPPSQFQPDSFGPEDPINQAQFYNQGSGLLADPYNPVNQMQYAQGMASVPGYEGYGAAMAGQALGQFSPKAQMENQLARQKMQMMQQLMPQFGGASGGQFGPMALAQNKARAQAAGLEGIADAYGTMQEAQYPDLPTGMVYGPNGPEYLPGYLEGQERLKIAGKPEMTTIIGDKFPYEIPAGYMPKDINDPNAGLIPVPGGPKDPTVSKIAELQPLETETAYTRSLLSDLKDHPGLARAVGKSSIIPVIPGTDAADFVTRLEQIRGKQFLSAYQQLKGGGQITEVEGKKAEAAIARLDRAQTEEAFTKAIDEFDSILAKGIERARADAKVKMKVYNPVTQQQESVLAGYTMDSGVTVTFNQFVKTAMDDGRTFKEALEAWKRITK